MSDIDYDTEFKQLLARREAAQRTILELELLGDVNTTILPAADQERLDEAYRERDAVAEAISELLRRMGGEGPPP